MIPPSPRGEAISPERMAGWVSRFRFYRTSPDEPMIRAWLDLFKPEHHDLAARLLDCVTVKSEEEILRGYRQILESLNGWSRDEQQRNGRWFFVGFGGAGESGPHMLRLFREANGLAAARHDGMFCSTIDLPFKKLEAVDSVVFVDDFAGTGEQVSRTWPIIQELIASEAKSYLILTAATVGALDKLRSDTDLQVIASYTLPTEDNLFAPECTHFNATEKAVVESYGKKAEKKNPKGWGKCGLLFILSHKTPNNTLPIFHVNKRTWRGLFPRYVVPAE